MFVLIPNQTDPNAHREISENTNFLTIHDMLLSSVQFISIYVIIHTQVASDPNAHREISENTNFLTIYDMLFSTVQFISIRHNTHPGRKTLVNPIIYLVEAWDLSTHQPIESHSSQDDSHTV